MRYTKTLAGTKKKQTTRCTKHRQAPKKNAATTNKDHSSWFFLFFFCACAGLVHLVFFFWCLCRFGDSDFTKHWQAPKKQKKEKNQTRCTKHRQAPKKTKNIQQLLRGGPIFPGFFFCFLVPVQVWWLWLHKTLTGTKKKQKKTTTRCTKHRQAPKKNSSNYSEVDHSSWIF